MHRRITWLELNADLSRSQHAVDKRSLCRLKGLRLPVSDLRVLDPAYATQRRGCVLTRERCIVVCLESVRLIVLQECVLLPLERGGGVAPAQASLVAALEAAQREFAGLAPSGAHLHSTFSSALAPWMCVRVFGWTAANARPEAGL